LFVVQLRLTDGKLLSERPKKFHNSGQKLWRDQGVKIAVASHWVTNKDLSSSGIGT